MAKLEIPSIVVQSGTHSPPKMDRATRSRQWSMSQQSTCDEDCELVEGVADAQEQTSQSQDTTTPMTPVTHTTTSPSQTNNILTRSRSKNSLKLLKRSQAVHESTSPPPDLPPSPVNITFPPTASPPSSLPNNNNNTSTTVNNNKKNADSLGPNTRPTMKREGSNNSCDSNRSGHLSRGNSCDQSPEVSVEKWIVDKINSSKKDCNFMLKLESDFLNLVKDQKKSSLKYDPLPAYQRMIVHKCSEYWGLEHNTIKESMMVISKPKNYTPIERKISDLIDRDLSLNDEEPRRSILKRDSASFEESVSFKSPDRHSVDAPRRSKSFEEREEEYEKVRRRIFQPEHMNGNGNNNYNEKGRPQWPQVANSWFSDSSKLHPNNIPMARKLRKNESYESNELLKANSLRQTTTINKAHSFGGYDDPATSNNRVLTKQDSVSSVSSRVSPSSSGYKSLRSDATISATPSPTATPHLTTQLSSQSEVSPDPESEAVVWAVTSINSVPTGSVLINPQTGLPLVNADGSVYHFDPANPPNLHMDPDNRLSRRTPSNSREEEEPLVRSHNHHQSDSSTPNFAENNQVEVMHNSMMPPPMQHTVTSPATTHSVAPAPAHIMPYPLSQHVAPIHPLSYAGAAPSLMYSPSSPYNMGMAGSEQFPSIMQGSSMPPMMYGLPTSQYTLAQTPVSYDRTPLPMENTPSYEQSMRMMANLSIGDGHVRGRHTPMYVPPGQQQAAFAAPSYQGPTQYILTTGIPPPPPPVRIMPSTYPSSPDRPVDWVQPNHQSLVQPFYRGQGNAVGPVVPFPPTTASYGVMPMHGHLTAAPRPFHRMSTPPAAAPQAPMNPQFVNGYPVYSNGMIVSQYQPPPNAQGAMQMPQVLRASSHNQLGVGSTPVRVTQPNVATSADTSLLYMRSSPAQPPMPMMTQTLRPILGAGANAKPQISQGRAILGATSCPMAIRPIAPQNNNNKRPRPPRPNDAGASLQHCTSCLSRNAHQSCTRNRRQDFDSKHQTRRN